MDLFNSRNIDKRSDKELLEEFKKSHNKEVLTTLFMRYQHLVFGVCMKYLQNIENSKDAVMDIYERVFSELERHNVENFKGWLYVLSKNFVLMRIRSVQSKEEQQLTEVFMDNHMESGDTWHPFDETSSDQDLEWLQDCLNRLPENQRDCIQSFYLEKMSYKELSRERREAPGKVKSYIQNGRRNLKVCIEHKLKTSKS